MPFSPEEGDKTREILARAGVDVFADEPEHPVRIESQRTAHRLMRRQCWSIGLLPASAEVGVVSLGVNLAIALAAQSGKAVGYVDASLRWPAFSEEHEQEDEEGPPTRPVARPLSAGEETAPAAYTTRWLQPDVALILPRRRKIAGALGALDLLLRTAREQLGLCVVNLTGWKRLGEHSTAFELLDGVAVVAHVGITTEGQVLEMSHEIPARRYLGILLTGATATAGSDVVDVVS